MEEDGSLVSTVALLPLPLHLIDRMFQALPLVLSRAGHLGSQGFSRIARKVALLMNLPTLPRAELTPPSSETQRWAR